MLIFILPDPQRLITLSYTMRMANMLFTKVTSNRCMSKYHPQNDGNESHL